MQVDVYFFTAIQEICNKSILNSYTNLPISHKTVVLHTCLIATDGRVVIHEALLLHRLRRHLPRYLLRQRWYCLLSKYYIHIIVEINIIMFKVKRNKYPE